LGLAWGTRFPGFGLLVGALFLRGAGLGVINVSISVLAYSDLEGAQIPHANGAIRILQQLGGSLGVAVLALILDSQGPPTVGSFHFAFWAALGVTASAVFSSSFLPRTSAGAPLGSHQA
jgi:hypothetical protein